MFEAVAVSVSEKQCARADETQVFGAGTTRVSEAWMLSVVEARVSVMSYATANESQARGDLGDIGTYS